MADSTLIDEAEERTVAELRGLLRELAAARLRCAGGRRNMQYQGTFHVGEDGNIRAEFVAVDPQQRRTYP